MAEHLHFRLRGGAWVIRQAQSKHGWMRPWIDRSRFETHLVFEAFGRRVVITCWKQQQLTDEEITRERQAYELKRLINHDP